MKTLDEVIESQERCTTYPNCHFCYLHSGPMCEWIRDALHYLKEYQEMLNTRIYIPEGYTREKTGFTHQDFANTFREEPHFIRDFMVGTSQNFADTSQVICPKCHSEFVILPEANNPLSWDELRQMEGKPVWVEILSDEIDLSSRWMMVARETKAHSLPLAYTDDMGHWIYGHEDDLGKTWQAYRKERE